MKELTSISSNVQTFTDVQRALDALKKKIDDLISNQNPTSTGNESEVDGEVGSIRVIENSDEESIFEIKTENGWKKPMVGNTPVSFKRLTEISKTTTKKSIDEIEAIDITNSDKVAEKTIFDEKADKFVIARPDYDSGWLVWDHSERIADDNDDPLSVTHNLGGFPTLAIIYFAPGANVVGGTGFGNSDIDNIDWFTPITYDLGEGYNNGIAAYISATEVKLHAGDSSSSAHSFDGTSTPRAQYTDGWVKILLWK